MAASEYLKLVTFTADNAKLQIFRFYILCRVIRSLKHGTCNVLTVHSSQKKQVNKEKTLS